MSSSSVVLHSHFYQPPRADPWTGDVPEEPSAAPFHDWNERIHAECYRPLTQARVLDDRGRVASLVNTLEWISWDAGPTLLRWLAREQPGTYRAFLEADARSHARLGSGNAIAAPYHHVILPLATRRDKVTEVRWGIADFRRRFGREPVGMWLPETAVDTETLAVLAAEGIRFTVLAPTQLETVPAGGGPGRVRLPGGRSIAVFAYDGGLAHDVAFGRALADGVAWAARITEVARDRPILSVATDGETFGHHQRWGDMALAAAVTRLATRREVRLENFATILARTPPVEDVVLVEPSSWSCAHGVERWRSECGCRANAERPTRQTWRTPLRDGLERLADGLHALFDKEVGALVNDPWALRDAFGATLDANEGDRRAVVGAAIGTGTSPALRERVLDLLDMERDALAMFTSCAWFFDDLARLEPIQALRFAAHALDLVGDAGSELEGALLLRLAEAESNDPGEGSGRRIWERHVRGSAGSDPVIRAREESEGHAADGSAVGSDTLRSAIRRLARAPGEDAADEVVAAAASMDRAGVSPQVETYFARLTARYRADPPRAVRRAAAALGLGDAFFETRGIGGSSPVGMVFGLHLHQPVGNFDEVFASHTQDVYFPLLTRLAERGFLPLTLHISGPLLEWLEARAHPLLDLVGRLAADGDVELLLSGFYEPVLPALSRADRAEQIARMRSFLSRRFGIDATGLWLTERVWEPDLAEDLVAAGVRHAFVDDRHVLSAGFDRRRLHRPLRTESGGAELALLPIDERLRYLIPFRSPDEVAAYLRQLRADDQPFAILADDGEKFGGWPGTARRVWEEGWLDAFIERMDALQADGEVRLVTAEEVAASTGSELVYLPSGSYREMEAWSLPPGAARRLASVEARSVGDAGDDGADAFVRGGHWRNFQARYAESNRMHRKAHALSRLCRERGDPEVARRAIARAQCNDAYWHGVFGGLYLRHLREAIWANLAEAEESLREGEPIAVEAAHLLGHGVPEVWVHSAEMSCIVSPARGGAIVELTHFGSRQNLVDVLTRRWEAYHRTVEPAAPGVRNAEGGAPSIHDLEDSLEFDALPPVDLDERALGVDRVLAADLDEVRYAAADYDPVQSWSTAVATVEWVTDDDQVDLHIELPGPGRMRKRLRVGADGSIDIRWSWDPAAFPPEARLAPEFSLSAEVEFGYDPPPVTVWQYEIATVSKSERGAETSPQGISRTPLWPCRIGAAHVRIEPPGRVPVGD